MKKFLSVLVILFSYLSVAAEVSVVMGRPYAPASKTIINHVDLAKNDQFDESSTWVYMLLELLGVKKTAGVYVMIDNFSTTELLIQGLQAAAHKAPIVLTTLGPIDHFVCSMMANSPNTVFVVSAGNDSLELKKEDLPSCAAGNILMVTSLHQEKIRLMPHANRGNLVRLAAPAYFLPVDVLGHMRVSGGAMAASLTAARLVEFSQKNTNLSGALLVDKFLSEQAVSLPELSLIDGGRALKL